jgi:hypothetical protein
MTTFNRAVYNLSMAQVASFAVAVHDPTPETSRLTAPVGGEDRIGKLKETTSAYTWQSQPAVHGDNHFSEPPPKPSATVSFPRDAPLPSRMGEATPPVVDILVSTGSPFSALVELVDELAASRTYCVSLGLGEPSKASAAPPAASQARSLRLDVRKTVSAHLISSPLGGSGYTRIDGSRCRRSRLIQIESLGNLPEKATQPIGLEEAIRRTPIEEALKRLDDTSLRQGSLEGIGAFKSPPAGLKNTVSPATRSP